jgi:hypothetical protein
LHRLVCYEFSENSLSAIIREKQIKNMSREEKIDLVRQSNPTLRDLFEDIQEGFRTDPGQRRDRSRNDKLRGKDLMYKQTLMNQDDSYQWFEYSTRRLT